MKSIELAERYARAFFELAEDAGGVETSRDELAVIHKVILKNAPVRGFFENPLIKNTDKKASVEKLAKNKVGALVRHFLLVLIEKRRIDALPDIVEQLDAIIDEKKGVQKAEVVSARELDKSIAAKIKNLLECRTGKKVACHFEQNPSLLGGVQIRLGNRLIDGSVRSKLDKLASLIQTAKVV